MAFLKQQQPDLIFLDLMMPDIDGIEVARRIRANPSMQNLPIVLFTAHWEELQEEDRQLVDAILYKPVDENKLLALLASITHSRNG